jgi:hypothetical protein
VREKGMMLQRSIIPSIAGEVFGVCRVENFIVVLHFHSLHLPLTYIQFHPTRIFSSFFRDSTEAREASLQHNRTYRLCAESTALLAHQHEDRAVKKSEKIAFVSCIEWEEGKKIHSIFSFYIFSCICGSS